MSVTHDARPCTVPTVLIVDDHDLVAMSLALCLRAEGMPAHRHAARSRDGVLTAAATMGPGILLLDLDLGREPDGTPVDGVDLVERLVRTGWRVVVLTASTDEARLGRAVAAGAVAEIPKTAELATLVTTIRRVAMGVEALHPARRRRLLEAHHARLDQVGGVGARLARLTERERAVLERLSLGRRPQAVATEFGTTLATTRTQIRSVLHKLEVSGQLEAVALLNGYRRAGGGA
jgi:DNA-binding NarL/FixJ family response regulator